MNTQSTKPKILSLSITPKNKDKHKEYEFMTFTTDTILVKNNGSPVQFPISDTPKDQETRYIFYGYIEEKIYPLFAFLHKLDNNNQDIIQLIKGDVEKMTSFPQNRAKLGFNLEDYEIKVDIK